MNIKTNFTLDYMRQYFERNNIQLPNDLNLSSIFKECDKYDEEGNEVKDGDGILQTYEISAFFNKIGKYGSKFLSATFECWQEVLKKQEQEKLEVKQERLNNPPKAYDENGIGEEGMDYILEKLESKGIGIEKIDFDILVDIMARFDYDIDPDLDSKITTKEANSFYSPEYANKYMNKDINNL